MFFITFTSSFLGLFGKKATFVVTPKSSGRVSFLQAVRMQLGELLFSVLLATAAALCAGSIRQGIAAVLLVSLTGILSVFLPLLSNRKYGAEQTSLVDKKTADISFRKNRLAGMSA